MSHTKLHVFYIGTSWNICGAVLESIGLGNVALLPGNVNKSSINLFTDSLHTATSRYGYLYRYFGKTKVIKIK